MEGEGIDRTTVCWVGYDIHGEIEIGSNTIFFKDVDNYEHLPPSCKCERTKIGFEKFKKKEKEDRIINKRLNKLLDSARKNRGKII